MSALRLVVAAVLAGACAPASTRMAAQLETVEAEQAPEKLFERGRAFAVVGDYTRAEQYLSAALDEGTDPDVALPLLIRVCVAERRYRAALAYAEPHLRKRPEDHRLRFVVASLYASIGETATARELLAEVARAKPDLAEVHFAMGMLTRDGEGDAVAADAHFREYLRLAPNGPHADEARGYLLRRLP